MRRSPPWEVEKAAVRACSKEPREPLTFWCSNRRCRPWRDSWPEVELEAANPRSVRGRGAGNRSRLLARPLDLAPDHFPGRLRARLGPAVTGEWKSVFLAGSYAGGIAGAGTADLAPHRRAGARRRSGRAAQTAGAARAA